MSWADTYVSFIDSEGNEHLVTNITDITWHAGRGHDAPYATLTFINVELDVEALVDP